MKSKRLKMLVLLTILSIAVYAGCQDDSDNDSNTATAPFQLTMIDAPVDAADHVYLPISSIAVHPTDAADAQDDEAEKNGNEGGADDPGYGSWIDLEIEPATYDLLELQNNAGVLLADQELPVGDYNQIRLLLDCENDGPTIVVEGETFPLTIPSGCQSGFKLPGHFTVAEGQETKLIMDFDARKSITLTGSDEYILKPVVRIFQEEEVGTISGTVEPVDSLASVYAFEAGTYTGEGDDPLADAANSTSIRGDGSFVLAALPAGTYDVVIEAEGYENGVYVSDVEVTEGQDTLLDPIDLLPEE